MIDMSEAKNAAKRYVKKEIDKDAEIEVESNKIKEVQDISVFEVEGQVKVSKDPLHTEKKRFSVQVRSDNGEIIGFEYEQ